ncbi:protein DMP10-like isoform X2 [Carex rostrata]
MASSSPAIQAVKNQPQIELNGNDLESGTALNQETPKALSASVPTSSTSMLITNKTLSSTANLAQLLPTGTVLAFESLSSSFTDNGVCHTSNKFLTALLIYFCLLSCVFFSFTDSLVGKDGKLYYGLATFKGFYVFNFTGTDEEATNTFHNLKRLRIRIVDFVHAIFSSLVFLGVAFSDTGVQRCYFPSADSNVKELFVNLPIGAAVLASFVFTIFPTTRKGIGYTNGTKQHS